MGPIDFGPHEEIISEVFFKPPESMDGWKTFFAHFFFGSFLFFGSVSVDVP